MLYLVNEMAWNKSINFTAKAQDVLTQDEMAHQRVIGVVRK